jgi:hypothetical protein
MKYELKRVGLSAALMVSLFFGLLLGFIYWAAMMVLVLSDPEGLAYIGFIMFSVTAGCIVMASCILGVATAAAYNFFAKHVTGLEIETKEA